MIGPLQHPQPSISYAMHRINYDHYADTLPDPKKGRKISALSPTELFPQA